MSEPPCVGWMWRGCGWGERPVALWSSSSEPPPFVAVDPAGGGQPSERGVRRAWLDSGFEGCFDGVQRAATGGRQGVEDAGCHPIQAVAWSCRRGGGGGGWGGGAGVAQVLDDL